MLAAAMAGKRDPRVVPPVPDYAKLEWKDNYLSLDGKPVLLVTVGNSGGGSADKRFARQGRPVRHRGGRGRQPLRLRQDPDLANSTRRTPRATASTIGGWCGHIIKDKWSIGGAGGDSGVCVISLDYPPMLKAVRQIHRRQGPCVSQGQQLKRNKILAMDWEYTYENYDEPSKVKWQNWLKDRYQSVDAVNKVWKTRFKSFQQIELPPIDSSDEKNPAKYYDHGEFSLWRFTDYLKWARTVISHEVPDMPIMVGGGMPLGSRFWKESIDEEGLMTQKVEDIWLSETGSRSWGTAAFMDLQHSMNRKMPIVDPEYHSTGGYLCLMFLHGAASADFWNWQAATDSSLGDGYWLNMAFWTSADWRSTSSNSPKSSPRWPSCTAGLP